MIVERALGRRGSAGFVTEQVLCRQKVSSLCSRVGGDLRGFGLPVPVISIGISREIVRAARSAGCAIALPFGALGGDGVSSGTIGTPASVSPTWAGQVGSAVVSAGSPAWRVLWMVCIFVSIPPPPRVFISYATEDEPFARALERHLAPLTRTGEMVVTSARAVLAGDDLRAAIESHLGAAEVVLLVVSAHYLETKGGAGEEMATALRHREVNGVAVVPVLVRSCVVEATLLGRLQSLPEDGRPIGARPDQDEAWLCVVRAVRRLVHERAPGRSRVRAPVLPRVPYFLGRDALATEVVTALVGEIPQSVVLLGGPGIGKTTVSLAVLHRPPVARRFGTRRAFARLDGATNVDAAIGAVAQAAGVGPTSDLRGALRAWLCEAPALVVLDNLETPHDADPAATEALLAWLTEIPDVVVLASVRGSGRPSGVAWRAVDLRPLGPQAAAEIFCALAPEHAANREKVLDLVAPLGGVPLAIALLAHAAHGNDLSNLRREWHAQRTATLGGGGTDKHVNWAACVEVSFARPRMTVDAERLARVLALLPEGAAAEDLPELVPNGPAAARLLAQVGLAYFDAGRLRMLPPVRDHVAAARRPELVDRARAAEHYRTLVESLGPKAGKHGGREAIARLGPEWGNVEVMMRWGLEAAEPTKWIDAAVALCNFVRFSGIGRSEVLEQALRRAERAGDGIRAVMCGHAIGLIAIHRSDLNGAHSRFETALALSREAGQTLDEAKCIERLGEIALARSDLAEARRQYETALVLFRLVGERRGEANCILSLGHIALRRSQHEEARHRYDTALPLYRQTGSVLGEAVCINSIGDIALDRSEHDEARQYYETALPLHRQVGSVRGEAACIKSLGDIAFVRKDLVEAKERYETALPLYRQVGDVQGEASCILCLGDIACAESRNIDAGVQYGEALALYARIPEPRSMGIAHRQLAQLASTDADRNRHIEAAGKLWAQIDRLDLVADLERTFGS